MGFFYGFIGFVAVIVIAVYLLVLKIGNAKFNLKTEDHTPFVVELMTDDSIMLSTKIEFANEGKQCGTIMDCYVRHLLPYEQFDGVRIYSKAELDGAPREDDYFEAVLIQRNSSIHIVIQIILTARKAAKIKEVLTNMVDLPIDVVYQYVARDPWAIGKKRIVITAEEIAKLAGVTLADK